MKIWHKRTNRHIHTHREFVVSLSITNGTIPKIISKDKDDLNSMIKHFGPIDTSKTAPWQLQNAHPFMLQETLRPSSSCRRGCRPTLSPVLIHPAVFMFSSKAFSRLSAWTGNWWKVLWLVSVMQRGKWNEPIICKALNSGPVCPKVVTPWSPGKKEGWH